MAFDFPASPTNGQEYTSGSATYVWTAGTGWLVKGGSGGGSGASITIADTPPVGAHGSMWWESDTNILWIYYNDGTSSQWVQTNPSGAGGIATLQMGDTPPISPTTGSMWWESDSGALWLWYDDGNTAQWVQLNGGVPPNVYVKLAGDTMIGNLKISKAAAPTLTLDRTAAGSDATIESTLNGVRRWALAFGGSGAETGSNAGSDIALANFSDTGVFITTPLLVSRATSQITTSAPILPQTTWTAAQQLSARKSVYAAPFDALAYNGLMVNGGFDIAQEFPNDQIGMAAAGYICDTVLWGNSGGAFTLGRRSGLVGPTSLLNALFMQATTAVPAPAVGGYSTLFMYVEGLRTARLNWGGSKTYQQPLTVSFWVYSSAGGIISVAVRNYPVNRSYVVPLTIPAATWSYQSITFPVDTGGTWAFDNTTGMTFTVTFAANPSGTYTTATANAWIAGNFIAHASQGNVFSATNSSAYLAGVTMFAGSQGPTSDQVINALRDPIQELPLVQRYFEMGGAGWTGLWYATTGLQVFGQHVEKRVIPTFSIRPDGAYYVEVMTLNTYTGNNSVLSLGNSNPTPKAGRVTINGFAAIGYTPPISGALMTDSIKIDARL